MTTTSTQSLRRAALPAALFAAVAAVGAASGDDAAAAASSTTTTLRFVAVDQQGNQAFADIADPQDGQPGIGDVLAFTQSLKRHGRIVGNASVAAIGVDAKRNLFEATGTLRLHHGTIQVSGIVAQAPTFTLAVVGGTGKYQAAAGRMAFDASGSRQHIVVTLLGR